MAKLISLNEIRAQKISRQRTWFHEKMRDTDNPFPQPVVADGGSNLWSEDEVDAWIERFVALARKRAEESGERRTQKSRRMTAGRSLGQVPLPEQRPGA